MSKKLYYTDPLAAAYMAREFGVRFHDENNAVEYGDNYKLYGLLDFIEPVYWPGDEPPVEIEKYTAAYERYYVHPDSYHIFDPQEGDRDEDGYTYDSKIEAWVSLPHFDENYGELVTMKGPKESKTARRNNEPFFWPESEEEC